MPGLTDKWNIVAAGEIAFDRELPASEEEIEEIMSRASVAYAHLQMVFGEKVSSCISRNDRIEKSFLAEPDTARHLSSIGINIVSLAGKRSFDYGPNGIFSTIDACEKAGVVHAGCGISLDRAREPGYLETETGRAGLIAASTGNSANEWSNLSRGGMKTRAGHNPVRAKVRLNVPKDVAEKLKEMGKELSVMRGYNPSNSASDIEEDEFRIMFPGEQATHGAFGTYNVFSAQDDYSVSSSCAPKDIKGNLQSVKTALGNSDLIIVSHDYSICEELYGEDAPDFAKEFAHAVIDGGADAYFGHGYGRLMGVEIYKGKPVFYGFGNFINTRIISSQDQETLFAEAASIIADITFDKEKNVEKIIFYPVELGIKVINGAIAAERIHGIHLEGSPVVAEGKCASRIIQKVSTLSAKYGTDITEKEGKGIWLRQG